MTSKQVNDENEALSNTMYKLLKKYLAIRSILKTLNVSCLPDLNLGGTGIIQFFCSTKLKPSLLTALATLISILYNKLSSNKKNLGRAKIRTRGGRVRSTKATSCYALPPSIIELHGFVDYRSFLVFSTFNSV